MRYVIEELEVEEIVLATGVEPDIREYYSVEQDRWVDVEYFEEDDMPRTISTKTWEYPGYLLMQTSDDEFIVIGHEGVDVFSCLFEFDEYTPLPEDSSLRQRILSDILPQLAT